MSRWVAPRRDAPNHLVGSAITPTSAPEDKRFVYVLKSADPKPHFYVGDTHDVRGRLADHNAGRCPHTARYRPGTCTSPSNFLTSNELSISDAISNQDPVVLSRSGIFG